MPPRAKKQRLSPTHDDRSEEEEEPEASHLVSFLTGYDAARPNEDHEDQSSDEERDGIHEEDDEEEEEDPDNDEDTDATPTKRAKTGLVGTPSSRKSTPRKKVGTPTSTPRKRKAATR